ncbi:MAG: LytTR family transcriptional regulator [Bacteroidales bacterium]|nr:LytTR family transcriptional regulator [Bacteroidales bacterium]MCF8389919.1 LytTR family transcriptional regulator [Bacteroidales bacterium]
MKKRIPFSTKNSIHFVDPDEILYCKSNNSSSIIHMRNEKDILVSIGIKAVENLLKGNNFFRPHQSYLVNLDHVDYVDKANEYTLVLMNAEKIPTAIRRRKEILERIKNGV